jgi:hypothetical protein
MQFVLGIAVHLPCLAVQDDSRSFGSHYFFVDFSITHKENLLYDTPIFWHLPKHAVQLCLCQVPLQFCDTFARTHRSAKNRKFDTFI